MKINYFIFCLTKFRIAQQKETRVFLEIIPKVEGLYVKINNE